MRSDDSNTRQDDDVRDLQFFYKFFLCVDEVETNERNKYERHTKPKKYS